MSTQKLTKEDMFEELTNLHKRCEHWEANEHKSSNDVLYGILKECYILHCKMSGKEHLIKAFNEKLKNGNYIYKKGTNLSTKIVSHIFPNYNKRTQAYARVIEWARDNNIDPKDFAAQIQDAGGIEEIRRGNSTSEEKKNTKKHNIQIAKDYLVSEGAPSLASTKPTSAIEHNSDTGVKFVVGLLHIKDDGHITLVAYDNAEAAVDHALEKYGRTHRDMIAKQLIQQREQAPTDMNALDKRVEAAKLSANSEE